MAHLPLKMRHQRTVFVQSGQQTIADYVAGALPTASTYRYVYASYIDEPVMRWQTSNSARVYYHRNQQYSVTALTNNTGAVLERYAYTAYGVPTITTATGVLRSVSAHANRYLYTGREWDPTIFQYHYRARMYDANLGRFCSRDPIGYLDGFNGYANQWLLSGVDPSGNLAANQAQGACNIHLYRYPQYTGQGLIPVGDHIGAMIEWGPFSQDYIDGTTGNDVEETHGRPRNRPEKPTASFFNQSQETCDCFAQSAKEWREVPRDQRVRDDLTRNSNWIMKCLLKRCGLSVNWKGGAPPGWNGRSSKCLEWKTESRLAGSAPFGVWCPVTYCANAQECPDGFNTNVLANGNKEKKHAAQ